jgi:hypothetical protein
MLLTVQALFKGFFAEILGAVRGFLTDDFRGLSQFLQTIVGFVMYEYLFF